MVREAKGEGHTCTVHGMACSPGPGVQQLLTLQQHTSVAIAEGMVNQQSP